MTSKAQKIINDKWETQVSILTVLESPDKEIFVESNEIIESISNELRDAVLGFERRHPTLRGHFQSKSLKYGKKVSVFFLAAPSGHINAVSVFEENHWEEIANTITGILAPIGASVYVEEYCFDRKFQLRWNSYLKVKRS